MDLGQEIKPQNYDLELFIGENDENFNLEPTRWNSKSSFERSQFS
jgi:hypothetical protein